MASLVHLEMHINGFTELVRELGPDELRRPIVWRGEIVDREDSAVAKTLKDNPDCFQLPPRPLLAA